MESDSRSHQSESDELISAADFFVLELSGVLPMMVQEAD